MRVLITGGAGYVGSVAAQALLSEGHRVCAFDKLLHGGDSLLALWSHENFTFVRGDVRDRDAVRAAVREADAVLHLAAIVGDPACARQRELAVATNHEASLTLLEECKRARVSRFVFASTCSNYGKMPDPNQCLDETAELRPVSLYAQTKVDVELALLDPAVGNGLCATPLRLATVFGTSPRMRFDLTVSEFTMELCTKKRLVVFGEQFWRPYVHVRDVARAFAMVLQAPAEKVRGQVFNVGSTEQNYTKQQLVEMILKHVPDGKIEYVHKQEDPRDYRVSFAKIQRVLGFQATRSVEDGVLEVVRLARDGVISDFDQAKFRN